MKNLFFPRRLSKFVVFSVEIHVMHLVCGVRSIFRFLVDNFEEMFGVIDQFVEQKDRYDFP